MPAEIQIPEEVFVELKGLREIVVYYREKVRLLELELLTIGNLLLEKGFYTKPELEAMQKRVMEMKKSEYENALTIAEEVKERENKRVKHTIPVGDLAGRAMARQVEMMKNKTNMLNNIARQSERQKSQGHNLR